MTATQDRRIAEPEAQLAERDHRIATLEDRVASQPSGRAVRDMVIDQDITRLAEAMRAYHARPPGADHEWMWIVGCAKLEATSHQYAKHVPRLRRWLAAQLLADEIVAGTSH